MNLRTIAALVGLCLIGTMASAQVSMDLDIKLSEEFKGLGYADGFAGIDDDFIYLKVSDNKSGSSKDKSVMIQKLDKRSLKEVAKAEIYADFRKQNGDLRFGDAKLTTDGIILFLWSKKKDQRTDYVAKFSKDLKLTVPLKQVHTFDSEATSIRYSIDKGGLTIVYKYNNRKLGDPVFEYSNLDQDLNLVKESVLEFPQVDGLSRGEFDGSDITTFGFTVQGNIIYERRIYLDNSDRRKGSKYAVAFYRTAKGTVQSFDVALDKGMYFDEIDIRIADDERRIYAVGVFANPNAGYSTEGKVVFKSNKERDVKRESSGYFTYVYDLEKNAYTARHQAYFSDELLASLGENTGFEKSDFNVADYMSSNLSRTMFDEKRQQALMLFELSADWYKIYEGSSTLKEYSTVRGKMLVLCVKLNDGRLLWHNSTPMRLEYSSRSSRIYDYKGGSLIKADNHYTLAYNSNQYFVDGKSDQGGAFKSSNYRTSFLLARMHPETGVMTHIPPPEADSKAGDTERLKLNSYYFDDEGEALITLNREPGNSKKVYSIGRMGY